MRGVVGVDLDGSYRLGVDLLARLNFDSNLTAELVHVAEAVPMLVGAPVPGQGDPYWRPDNVCEETGEALLALAQLEVKAAKIANTTLLGMGHPGKTLAKRAEETDADLIVIGSTHKSKVNALLHGSIGRTLTLLAHRSVLIAKNDVLAIGDLTAVFATDCSDYADDCLRLLLRMRPRGIRRFVIVTAVKEFHEGSPPSDLRQHVWALQRHLHEAGFEADPRIIEGDAAYVIDRTMADNHADLLIVASPYHGTLERIVFGSLSLREVVAKPHSLLLLRTRH